MASKSCSTVFPALSWWILSADNRAVSPTPHFHKNVICDKRFTTVTLNNNPAKFIKNIYK
ncbi:hypothetical protein [Photorhabdus khanii]|uniref:hypothetical protein n=1 Tax=Photorhabdus khanii TaxID=1004150 RepID=UPI00128F42D5|nr:hypothetical protein [Photorhabdus khanii]